MPNEIRLFIRTSLVCLVLSALVGTLKFALYPVFAMSPPYWLVDVHTHLATVGWLVNMVFGVALWMFPLPWGATAAERYRPGTVRLAYVGLNGGLAIRILGDAINSNAILIASGLLQTGGILLCVIAV